MQRPEAPMGRLKPVLLSCRRKLPYGAMATAPRQRDVVDLRQGGLRRLTAASLYRGGLRHLAAPHHGTGMPRVVATRIIDCKAHSAVWRRLGSFSSMRATTCSTSP